MNNYFSTFYIFDLFIKLETIEEIQDFFDQIEIIWIIIVRNVIFK